jgi:cysteine sulfinate desulfinase/cysteine desulfurase-like protein
MDTYLDYNATTPARPEVIAAMGAALTQVGHAAAGPRFGRGARRAGEAARAAGR